MHQLRQAPWTERFQKSPYFLGALLFHLIIGTFLTAYIVIPAPPAKHEDPYTIFLPPNSGKEAPEHLAPPDPQDHLSESGGNPSDVVSIPTPSSDESGSPIDALIQMTQPTIDGVAIAKGELKPGPIGELLRETQQKIGEYNQGTFQKNDQKRKEFYGKWYTEGGDHSAKKVASFTVYVGKVEELNAKKLLINENGLEDGPLHHLMTMAEQWSHQSMKPQVSSELLDLADEALIEKAPPFIFLSGSRDFRFTEKEVKNIQRYLSVGGAIWADNGLAGRGSRFDLAFRREMKRVVGELEFEVLPLEHPIFQGPKSLFQISSVPEGMNYRNDPFEVIRIDGEIAVIYTPNNYTDMMRMVFQTPLKLKGNQTLVFDRKKEGSEKITSTPLSLWKERETFFRNFQPESSEQVFRLGTNLIFHLITRWQDRLG
ncbi:MAG: DUF4159 domain-containing protein [Verrucomicrobiota bacterium]